MKVMQVLSAFLLFSLFESGVSQDNGCCSAKSVGEVEYRLINADGPTAGFNCINKCVYEQFGIPGSRFCFAKGPLPVLCLTELISSWNSKITVEIVERVNEQYKKLAAETSFETAEAKLESFLKEMTEITGLYPNSSDPFLSAFKNVQNDLITMLEGNVEPINNALKQLASEIQSFLSSKSKSVTVQDVKEKVKMLSKDVNQKYAEGSMFNTELGISLVTLVALESMANLFLPVSRGGQGAEKTLFYAMYANTTTTPPTYPEPECCDNVIRAWQGSFGALLDGLIKFAQENFPDVQNFNDFGVQNYVPLTHAFNIVAVDVGAIGSRMISTEIFKNLMTPTNK